MDKIRLTTKDDDYPIIDMVFDRPIPGGAGFLPSTVPSQVKDTDVFFIYSYLYLAEGCGIKHASKRIWQIRWLIRPSEKYVKVKLDHFLQKG